MTFPPICKIRVWCSTLNQHERDARRWDAKAKPRHYLVFDTVGELPDSSFPCPEKGCKGVIMVRPPAKT